MSDLYEFPMTLEEAEFILDRLRETKNTLYVGMKEMFTVKEKEMMENIIDSLSTWIDNRSVE